MVVDDATIGTRLQLARRSVGLTQGEVGNRLGMATSTVSEIESGKRAVTGTELNEFAHLYHRPLAFFFEEEPSGSPGFGYLFRAPDLDIRDRESLVELEQLAKDYASVEKLTGVGELPLPPDYSQFNFENDQDAEALADMERGRLALGEAPLRDLMNLLDGTVGIRTFLIPVRNQSWSGVVVRDADGRPCIAVNLKEEPYRRNFGLAHEYAHVLVHLARSGVPLARIDKTFELVRTSADERFANAFASAFLMPRPAVLAQLQRVLRANNGEFTDYDLVHLAMQFGVSGQALSWRLVSLRKLTRQEHQQIWKTQRTFKSLAEALGYTVEDWDPANPVVLPTRFRYLAMRAYEDARISLAKLAELLRESYVRLSRGLEYEAEQVEAGAG